MERLGFTDIVLPQKNVMVSVVLHSRCSAVLHNRLGVVLQSRGSTVLHNGMSDVYTMNWVLFYKM